jgi:glucan biosynthesis protein C
METPSIHESRPGGPTRLARDAATDYLRLAVILLVVFIHAALAYASFSRYDPKHYVDATAPIVDPARWPLLDSPILFIDTFAMPLLFLVSGLFVFSGLERKGSGGYFLPRLKRLGVPFIAAAFLLSPLAFWPGYLRSIPDSSVPYWIRFFTTDGWMIGAAWFLWVLLAFDAIIALLHRMAPALLNALHRKPSPLFVLAATAIVFVPAGMAVSPYSWLTPIGPFDVQPARVPLYFLYFLLGMALGSKGGARETVWPTHWGLYLLAGLVSFAAYMLVGVNARGFALRAVAMTAFAGSCAGTTLGLGGAFHRFAQKHIPALDVLAACSFGIYLFHYPIMHWLQYALLLQAWPAQEKFAAVFTGALALSICVTLIGRGVPGIRRFL